MLTAPIVVQEAKNATKVYGFQGRNSTTHIDLWSVFKGL